jgi:hypothetical protein
MRTEIETGDGRFELYDFAPRIMQGCASMRRSRSAGCCCRSPDAASRVHFDPQPDYARANFEIVAAGQGIEGRRRPNAPVSLRRTCRRRTYWTDRRSGSIGRFSLR